MRMKNNAVMRTMKEIRKVSIKETINCLLVQEKDISDKGMKPKEHCQKLRLKIQSCTLNKINYLIGIVPCRN